MKNVIMDILKVNVIPTELKNAENIIKKYDADPKNYADPIMCKEKHLTGKAYITENDKTIFWFDLMDIKYFFDVQSGKQ